MQVEYIGYPMTLDRDADVSKLSIAIGFFDGVHHGHRNVIQRAVEKAHANGWQAAIMTFDPHPREVISPDLSSVSVLTPLDEKLKRFAELGVDRVYVVRFDAALARVTPDSFVQEVLLPLGVQHAVVGFDFKFGHRGAGTAQSLQELSDNRISVDVVQPLNREELKVSSSYVRESLQEGNVELAAELLGRPYEIIGKVVHGDARGRLIGFPTANVEPLFPYALPRLGVYAISLALLTEGELNKESTIEAEYKGMLNHGMKPTFNETEIRPVLEAHLFEFSSDIYDRLVIVRFHHFLRSEQKFDGVQKLIEQLNQDKEQAMQFLGSINQE